MTDLLDLTTEIVAAHVSRNEIEGSDIPGLIRSVYTALAKASVPEEPAKAAEPAVPIKRSVFDDHVVCLACGKSFRTLKRHLQTDHRLTLDEYRARFGLPDDHPVIASEFAAIRARIARSIGLGRATGRRTPKKA